MALASSDNQIGESTPRTVRFLMVPVDRSCEGRRAQVRLGAGAVGVAPAAQALGFHGRRFGHCWGRVRRRTRQPEGTISAAWGSTLIPPKTYGPRNRPALFEYRARSGDISALALGIIETKADAMDRLKMTRILRARFDPGT